MKIEHIAIWTQDLENLKHFYETYFGAKSGSKYQNLEKQFSSYFLTFSSGARLELMSMASIKALDLPATAQHIGLIHVAFSLGSKENVDRCYAQFRASGLNLLDSPRVTGDGYYEFTLLDPDGNRIEVTA
ncbi:VOC family protein [Corallincola platygyrae]|uniref:VOC family protein n=1 Tax=Corallincola platygyrae TaxID=1193278 RepID=A0ABW4XNP3_9GAMM